MFHGSGMISTGDDDSARKHAGEGGGDVDVVHGDSSMLSGDSLIA